LLVLSLGQLLLFSFWKMLKCLFIFS
jgi:hypothetical protein